MGPRLQGDGALVRDEPDAADDHPRPAARRARLPRRPDGPELHRLPRRPLPARSTTRPPATSTRSPSSPTRDADAPRRLRGVAARRRRRALAAAAAHAAAASARAGPATCSTSCAWRGACAGSTCAARPRRPACSRCRIADVLDEWFESPEVKGVLAINGIIGTWAGPEEPGTAYVMMHHTIGDVGDGHLGSWGYPIGGMGAVADAIRRVRRVVRRRGAHRRRRSSASTSPTAGCTASRPRDGARAARADRRRRDPPADHVPAPDRPPPSCPTTSSTTSALALAVGHGEGQRRALRAARLPRLARAPSRTSGSPARSSCATRIDYLAAGVPGRPRGPGRRRGRSPTASSRRRSTRRCAPRART